MNKCEIFVLFIQPYFESDPAAYKIFKQIVPLYTEYMPLTTFNSRLL